MTSLRKKIESTTPPRAGRCEWIGLALLAIACVLYAMDLTVLHLAVPSLSAELKPTSAQLLWIVDIYGFLVAGSLITLGTLRGHPLEVQSQEELRRSSNEKNYRS